MVKEKMGSKSKRKPQRKERSRRKAGKRKIGLGSYGIRKEEESREDADERQQW